MENETIVIIRLIQKCFFINMSCYTQNYLTSHRYCSPVKTIIIIGCHDFWAYRVSFVVYHLQRTDIWPPVKEFPWPSLSLSIYLLDEEKISMIQNHSNPWNLTRIGLCSQKIEESVRIRYFNKLRLNGDNSIRFFFVARSEIYRM